MSQTTTPAPTDAAMWRRLFLRVHPDQGGDGELFVWARELQERVMGGCGCAGAGFGDDIPPGEDPGEDVARVDFPGVADHDDLTSRALHLAAEVGEPYARLLEVLEGCQASPAFRYQEIRGASYKQLALIAHRAGMSKTERTGWYEVARLVPLSQRHAGYLIEHLGEGAA